MEQLTVYRAQGKEIGLTFLFKYDLNGNLKAFELQEGILNAAQMKWLFAGAHFPADESLMKSVWMAEKGYTDKFVITISPADLSFDALWTLYAYKLARKDAEKAYAKLKQADLIAVFIDVPKYLEWLARNPKIQQLNLATYLNGRRYEDERPEVFTPPPKERVGKVFNPALQALAKKKTEK